MINTNDHCEKCHTEIDLTNTNDLGQVVCPKCGTPKEYNFTF